MSDARRTDDARTNMAGRTAGGDAYSVSVVCDHCHLPIAVGEQWGRITRGNYQTWRYVVRLHRSKACLRGIVADVG